jgi:hypothetical protein
MSQLSPPQLKLDSHTADDPAGDEERIVAELELLGITYLSRCTAGSTVSLRPVDSLLADLVQQPSARVRAALIAVLLAHPEHSQAVPAALERLAPAKQTTFRLFYTAAVLLQQEHAQRLRPYATGGSLPDLFAKELGLPAAGSPRERLVALGDRHREQTRAAVNWVGTYESVVRRLLRSWELKTQWNP